jgi:HEPN domain-containing protein
MTHKIKTVRVNRESCVVFLEKAEQFLKTAIVSFESENYNASAANAVHACISAADALCARHLGERAAGDKHTDAVNLVKAIKNTDEFTNNAVRFGRVLAIKSLAEYEGRLVFKNDSEVVLKNSEKFIEFVKKNLPDNV